MGDDFRKLKNTCYRKIGKITDKSIHNLLFADDQVTIGHGQEDF